MATTIVTKYGSDAPAASDLVRGELAVDTENGRLYTENSSGAVVEIGLKPSGNVDVTGTVTADGVTSTTSSSMTQLTVNGTGAIESGINFASGGTTYGQIYFNNVSPYDMSVLQQYSTGSLIFGTNDTEAMRISSAGNASIGTSSAFGKLRVEDTGWSSGSPYGTVAYILGGDVNDANWGHLLVSQSGTTTGSGGKISFGADGANPIAGIKAYYAGATYGHLDFYTRPSGGTSTQRMRISSAGNVGIGTSPARPLHVSTSGVIPLRLTSTGTDCQIELGNSGGTPIIGSFNDQLIFKTASTERMRIDSNGTLLVGKSSTGLGTAGIELTHDDVILGTRSGGVVQYLNRLSSDGNVLVILQDGTTVGSLGAVSDSLYISSPYGSDAGLRFAASIINPCTTEGADRDDAIDLGKAGARFDDIYATNGTIQTSDRNEKQDIEELSDAEQRVAVAAKGLLRKFRWISSVEENGDDARIHFGIIAQDLQAAFDAEGLDAGRYAMFINSTWTDEETGEERSRMGVRYSELLAFIISAI